MKSIFLYSILATLAGVLMVLPAADSVASLSQTQDPSPGTTDTATVVV